MTIKKPLKGKRSRKGKTRSRFDKAVKAASSMSLGWDKYRFCTTMLLFSDKPVKHEFGKGVLAYGLTTDFTEWEKKDKAMGRLMTSMLTLIEQLIKEPA